MSMEGLLSQLLPEEEYPLEKGSVVTIHLSNGSTITVEKEPTYKETVWAWRVDGSVFSRDTFAEHHLQQRIQEKLTHTRVLMRPRYTRPNICGNICPHPEHDRALCNVCPVKDDVEAQKDGLQLIYATLSKQQLADIQKEALIYILEAIDACGFHITVYEENGKECGLEIEDWTPNGVDMVHLIDLRDCENPYDPNALLKELQLMVEYFDPDEETRLHLEGEDFRKDFSCYEAAVEFEQWQQNLRNMAHAVWDVENRVPALRRGLVFEDNLSYKQLLTVEE